MFILTIKICSNFSKQNNLILWGIYPVEERGCNPYPKFISETKFLMIFKWSWNSMMRWNDLGDQVVKIPKFAFVYYFFFICSSFLSFLGSCLRLWSSSSPGSHTNSQRLLFPHHISCLADKNCFCLLQWNMLLLISKTLFLNAKQCYYFSI